MDYPPENLITLLYYIHEISPIRKYIILKFNFKNVICVKKTDISLNEITGDLLYQSNVRGARILYNILCNSITNPKVLLKCLLE